MTPRQNCRSLIATETGISPEIWHVSFGADLKCTASTERHLPVFPSPKLLRSRIRDVKIFGIAPV
jgi:hypothetical protein